ncbi:transposase [Fulvivirgaceae bacterium BMA10]|uniref:Transposase n=1 Tax=Splendidivirga corallicola TaxID=3051826 RepID=A0ABT8KJR8_9BACT|nr:transposase [Fulvivirgaceae bacterium BMA10]
MEFIPGELYHIYNQGNNRETIFRKQDNYIYFLKKVKIHVQENCEILAYCLMPNHFHFLVMANKRSQENFRVGSLIVNQLSNGFRLLLSSYSKAINKQENRSGSLFRQKTKYKCLTLSSPYNDYPIVCFHYIHQNPLKAGLVEKMEDWEFSSFREYIDKEKEGLCDQNIAARFLDIDKQSFYSDSYSLIEPMELKNIF